MTEWKKHIKDFDFEHKLNINGLRTWEFFCLPNIIFKP